MLVLVGHSNQVKIADFGLARFTTENQMYEAREGTRFPIKWTAPEAAMTSVFTIKSDVWSFGIVLSEIMTKGSMPYPNMSNAEVLRALDTGYRMPRPITCPEALYERMLQCWLAEPQRRPTFETLRWELVDYYSINSGSNYRESVVEAQPDPIN